MKTLAQRSLAAVRKVNKNWKVSICAEPMMELIRCMDMNNSDTTLCREAIRIMELCTSGAIMQTSRMTDHVYSNPALMNELLRRAK